MPIRLNIGCGPLPLHDQHKKLMDQYGDGWILVDKYVKDPAIVDYDAANLPFEAGSVDTIYCSHLLEHIPFGEVPNLVRHWHDLLTSGGELVINVPDFEWVCEVFMGRTVPQTNYYKASLEFTDPVHNLQAIIYGNQDHEGEYHKSAYDEHSLYKLLDQMGFETINIERVYEAHDMGCLLAKAVK